MRERFYRFMQGRYGSDGFCRFLSYLGLGFIILSWILRLLKGNAIADLVLSALALCCFVFSIFRMFSKNCNARSHENYSYYRVLNRVKSFFKNQKERLRQSKDYRFFRCPKCGVVNRVPKGKGKIRIRCPKCSEQFIRKS